MAENTVSLKDMERQEIEGEGNNCLKCVKWNNGKGLEFYIKEALNPRCSKRKAL